MAIISSFLCWSNTRTGSVFCGYYTLVISVVCLALYMLKYIVIDSIKQSIELTAIVYAGFILYTCLIGVSLMLLPGVYLDKKLLLLPWIYVLVMTVLYESGVIALITIVHSQGGHGLQTWEIFALAFYFVRLVANCYSFACVVSQYQELAEGRGTYEYFYKPSGQDADRGSSPPDHDEYCPPFGATLPPYSKENLYTDYSPPNYENLVIENDEVDNFSAISREDIVNTSERMRSEIFVNTSGRMRSEISSLYSSNVNSSATSQTFRERGCSHSIHSEVNYPDFSTSESSEDINKNPNRRKPQHISRFDLSPTAEYVKARRSSQDNAIAMTLSSSLTNYSPSQAHRLVTPSRTRPGPMSPYIVQKRTYITWI